MDKTDILNFKNEIECVQLCDHVNILGLHHFFEDKQKYMIITDMCYGGSLQDIIDKKWDLSLRDISIILK